MSPLRTISPKTARRLAISCQRLDGVKPAVTSQEILNIFKAIGCVQIDPLRAVERTQYLVLWSRLGNYDLRIFDDLLWKDRQLFEYWAHAASIVMTEDFPIYWRHMRDWAAGDKSWNKRARTWIAENQELQEHLLEELERNGPLTSTGFHDKSNTKWQSGGWTNGQTVRLMLGYLWEQGKILVSHRKGLTKYWDLRDRCLPDWTPREVLSWDETVYRAAQKSVLALGVGTEGHIKNHFTRGNYPDLAAVLERLLADGLLETVQIGDGSTPWTGTWYIHSDNLPLLDGIENGDWEPATTLLSPFDNLICHRERTEELFNFHFRIEIYVPKSKRQYGYYVLPILHGDTLIGRIDPKMDRKNKQLEVNAIYTEDGAPLNAASGRAVAETLKQLVQFLGANDIILPGQLPPEWRDSLKV